MAPGDSSQSAGRSFPAFDPPTVIIHSPNDRDKPDRASPSIFRSESYPARIKAWTISGQFDRPNPGKRCSAPLPDDKTPITTQYNDSSMSRILGVNMKNATAEFLDRRNQIDKLANQMTRVEFQADILQFRGRKETFPHRRLRQHVVAHDRQMVRSLRAMFEGDAPPFILRELCDRLPKGQQFRNEILERS